MSMFWSETSSTLSLSSAILSSDTAPSLAFDVAGLLGEPVNECVLNYINLQDRAGPTIGEQLAAARALPAHGSFFNAVLSPAAHARTAVEIILGPCSRRAKGCGTTQFAQPHNVASPQFLVGALKTLSNLQAAAIACERALSLRLVDFFTWQPFRRCGVAIE
jgi:hypothetical protein